MIKEKELFDLIDLIGNNMDDEFSKFHIIDHTDTPYVHENDKKYRVYHRDSICFDIEREFLFDPNDGLEYDEMNIDGFAYTYFDGYDGFQIVPIDSLLIKFRNLLTQK